MTTFSHYLKTKMSENETALAQWEDYGTRRAAFKQRKQRLMILAAEIQQNGAVRAEPYYVTVRDYDRYGAKIRIDFMNYDGEHTKDKTEYRIDLAGLNRPLRYVGVKHHRQIRNLTLCNARFINKTAIQAKIKNLTFENCRWETAESEVIHSDDTRVRATFNATGSPIVVRFRNLVNRGSSGKGLGLLSALAGGASASASSDRGSLLQSLLLASMLSKARQ